MTQTDTHRLTHVTHPLVQHKLSYLRDRDTPTVHFRKLVEEVTLLLTYEASKDMPTAVAIQWVDATTPKVPSISGLVVKGSGLMLLMDHLSHAYFGRN